MLLAHAAGAVEAAGGAAGAAQAARVTEGVVECSACKVRVHRECYGVPEGVGAVGAGKRESGCICLAFCWGFFFIYNSTSVRLLHTLGSVLITRFLFGPKDFVCIFCVCYQELGLKLLWMRRAILYTWHDNLLDTNCPLSPPLHLHLLFKFPRRRRRRPTDRSTDRRHENRQLPASSGSAFPAPLGSPSPLATSAPARAERSSASRGASSATPTVRSTPRGRESWMPPLVPRRKCLQRHRLPAFPERGGPPPPLLWRRRRRTRLRLRWLPAWLPAG